MIRTQDVDIARALTPGCFSWARKAMEGKFVGDHLWLKEVSYGRDHATWNGVVTLTAWNGSTKKVPFTQEKYVDGDLKRLREAVFEFFDEQYGVQSWTLTPPINQDIKVSMGVL